MGRLGRALQSQFDTRSEDETAEANALDQNMKHQFILLAGLALPVSPLSAAPEKPNIIIILSDDHGYTDLGIHGIDHNVQTPAMDQLAANGALMKFGYSTAPQCVPSRAGLMSGRVQNTFGLRGNGESDEPIPLDVPTIELAGGSVRCMLAGIHLAKRPVAGPA